MKDFIMTKYECARIIGIRSTQLSMSAPIQVEVPEHLRSNFMYVATKELLEQKLDMYVKRPLPHNKFYKIHVNQMEMPNDLLCLEEILNSEI